MPGKSHARTSWNALCSANQKSEELEHHLIIFQHVPQQVSTESTLSTLDGHIYFNPHQLANFSTTAMILGLNPTDQVVLARVLLRTRTSKHL